MVKTQQDILVETVPDKREEYEALSDDETTVGIQPASTVSQSASLDPLSVQIPLGKHHEARSSEKVRSRRPSSSLLDDSSVSRMTVQDDSSISRMIVQESTPGVAAFLEIEELPARSSKRVGTRRPMDLVEHDDEDLIDFTEADQPIRTSSGLLLTHRRTSHENRSKNRSKQGNNHHRPAMQRFEMEHRSFGNTRGDFFGMFTGSGLVQAKKLLSLAQTWIICFGFILIVGTATMLHSMKQEARMESDMDGYVRNVVDETTTERIILRPLYNLSSAESMQQQHGYTSAHHHTAHNNPGIRRRLSTLRDQFEEWVDEHKISYHSHEEKEKRFHIWTTNHERTEEKNMRHGRCTLTKQPVFGSNRFKDLSPQEFQSKFLSGYDGPTEDHVVMRSGKRKSTRQVSKKAKVLGPTHRSARHPEVHRRILEEWKSSGYEASTRCKWYDLSCWLQVFVTDYMYIGTGTMEPEYDAYSYPTSFDWRNLGAVSDVRTQGDCGACWGITAVETVESAYFISSGSLLKLSEQEVISCTDSCNMCLGGWPQEAYDYIMDKGGIILSDALSYDGSSLMQYSETFEDDSGELDENSFGSFIEETCPAYSSYSRYGNIKGYGYATDRCVCYSDGSGCSCDSQNEGVAVRNLASHGPATVCLDASTWQDYSSGIITSASGCSSKFLDMNHCVQVVGYAYNDGSGSGSNERNLNSQDGGSHDGGGSQDDSDREGYWIVRNQWSSNWGMNGYAYVAMGENTCGILNDMTQAYF